jgi:hypothetical protein
MALDNMAGREGYRTVLGDNLRAALVMVLGCCALVGLAFGAMVVLTSPDGWLTKAANSAMAGESDELMSFNLSSAD